MKHFSFLSNFLDVSSSLAYCTFVPCAGIVCLCDWFSVEEMALEEVALYPNPSTGVVFIESTFTGNFDLVVTDINGRTIQTGTTIPSGTNTTSAVEKIEHNSS